MGYPDGAANGTGNGERNGNGKRKETSGGGEDRETGPEKGGGGGLGRGEEFSFLPPMEVEVLEMLKNKRPEFLEQMGVTLGEDGWRVREGVGETKNASSDDDGSAKRARTDTV